MSSLHSVSFTVLELVFNHFRFDAAADNIVLARKVQLTTVNIVTSQLDANLVLIGRNGESAIWCC